MSWIFLKGQMPHWYLEQGIEWICTISLRMLLRLLFLEKLMNWLGKKKRERSSRGNFPSGILMQILIRGLSSSLSRVFLGDNWCCWFTLREDAMHQFLTFWLVFYWLYLYSFEFLFKCYKCLCHGNLPFLSSLLLIIQSAKQWIPTEDMYLMEGILGNLTESKLFGDELLNLHSLDIRSSLDKFLYKH